MSTGLRRAATPAPSEQPADDLLDMRMATALVALENAMRAVRLDALGEVASHIRHRAIKLLPAARRLTSALEALTTPAPGRPAERRAYIPQLKRRAFTEAQIIA